jgi:RNA polymerase sigma-70 factor (ECF subfamily)
MQKVDAGEGQNHIDIAFYERYAHLVYAYVRRKVSSQEDAEDVMTEVFVAATKNPHLAGFDTEQQIAWLQRVAYNKIIDGYRHRSRLTLLPLEQAMTMLDDQLTPEQYVVQQETYQRLYAALAQLPTVQQQIVRLRYGNQLRFVEIAAILDTSEVAVRNILHRTLHRLRSIFEQK